MKVVRDDGVIDVVPDTPRDRIEQRITFGQVLNYRLKFGQLASCIYILLNLCFFIFSFLCSSFFLRRIQVPPLALFATLAIAKSASFLPVSRPFISSAISWIFKLPRRLLESSVSQHS